MKFYTVPELLAPAGGLEHLKAAVQNGADAVYMGGPLFNARIKAENFTYDDMERAVDYAHERNVKVYITLNTLIKDNELSRAFSYVNFLYKTGVDGIILQDMGISRLIHKYFPQLPMHLSTQGTVYNKWAVDTAKELGFCRIVPARELTLSEIETFTEECHKGERSCEVEVFVHGALCMCYSGQCQMSRVLGGINGRSGNRGLCAQPCRLPYKDDEGREGYFLSPKDICQIDNIPLLCKAGVDSFKIEGRLKSPQYVAIVTAVYRKYLDVYREKGNVEVSQEDRKALLQIFNRGGFSEGYMFGNPGDDILSGSTPKNSGVYIGKVIRGQDGSKKHDKDGGKQKGSCLIDIKCKSPIFMGDGVEIRGKGHGGNIVTYLKELPEGLIRIGDIKERVYSGDFIYRVTEKALVKNAEKSYSDDWRRKSFVDIIFKGTVGRKPEMIMKEKLSGRSATVTGEKEIEKAVNHFADEERILKQLKKLGDTPFEAEDVKVYIDENSMIPVSYINMLRRKTAEALLEQKRDHRREGFTEEELRAIEEKEELCIGSKELIADKPLSESIRIYNEEQLERMWKVKGSLRRECTLYIPVELYMKKYGETLKVDGEVLPYILNVSKGRLDEYIEENFKEIVKAVRDTGILIGNLGWIKRFRDAGVKVFGDYGLNIYNMQSLKTFEELGVKMREPSHEMNENINEIPFMITEHPFKSAWLIDRKNVKYEMVKSDCGDKWLIFRKTKR